MNNDQSQRAPSVYEGRQPGLQRGHRTSAEAGHRAPGKMARTCATRVHTQAERRPGLGHRMRKYGNAHSEIFQWMFGLLESDCMHASLMELHINAGSPATLAPTYLGVLVGMLQCQHINWGNVELNLEGLSINNVLGSASHLGRVKSRQLHNGLIKSGGQASLERPGFMGRPIPGCVMRFMGQGMKVSKVKMETLGLIWISAELGNRVC